MSAFRRGLMSASAKINDVIEFEDPIVKTICVSNWGGNIVSGEITKREAALVTTLGDKFYDNPNITKFNELQYFTGLTTMYVQNVNSYAAGTFFRCTSLTEVTLPQAPITNMSGAFRICSSLGNVDLSPITTPFTMSCTFREACLPVSDTNPNGSIITLPCAFANGSWHYTFRSSTVSSASITQINVNGTADFSNITFISNTFYRQAQLRTLGGVWTNIKSDLDIHFSPLTTSSVIMLLNGLFDFSGTSTTKTLTLKASEQATYEADPNYITARNNALQKGWNIIFT